MHSGAGRLALMLALVSLFAARFVAAQEPSSIAPAAGDAADFHTLNDLGDSRFRQRDYRGALAAYLRAFRLNPTSSYVLENIGDTHRALRQPKKAVEAYAEAIRLIEIDPHGGTPSLRRRLHEKVIHYIEATPELREMFNGPAAPPFGKPLREYREEWRRLLCECEDRKAAGAEADRLRVKAEARDAGLDQVLVDLERQARERQILEELKRLNLRLAEIGGTVGRVKARREQENKLGDAIVGEETAEREAGARAHLEAARVQQELREELAAIEDRRNEMDRKRLAEALEERAAAKRSEGDMTPPDGGETPEEAARRATEEAERPRDLASEAERRAAEDAARRDDESRRRVEELVQAEQKARDAEEARLRADERIRENERRRREKVGTVPEGKSGAYPFTPPPDAPAPAAEAPPPPRSPGGDATAPPPAPAAEAPTPVEPNTPIPPPVVIRRPPKGTLRIPPSPPTSGEPASRGGSRPADLAPPEEAGTQIHASGESIDVCLKSLQTDTENWELWERLGDAYRFQNYRADARYAYERAIGLRQGFEPRLERKLALVSE